MHKEACRRVSEMHVRNVTSAYAICASKRKKACMHTCIRTRCCDLHTSARRQRPKAALSTGPLFSCCGEEKEREGQRIRPVPLSRLVSNSSSPSRQACAGLWLGSPAARLGLWNNRRPPRRLGGVVWTPSTDRSASRWMVRVSKHTISVSATCKWSRVYHGTCNRLSKARRASSRLE